ncbi:MAG: beta-lactamase family protein [Acidimicrobiia bacterium]|nr:beta-lactamase family protein [Acidimicrobiia bacterium]
MVKLATESKYQSLLDELIRGGAAPGAALGIVTLTGEMVLATSGVRSLIDDSPIRSGDHFHLGSCAKAITATVAAELVEEGLINWYEPISSVCDLPTEASLAQLLNHTAGLPPFEEERELLGMPELPKDAVQNRRGFAEFVLGHRDSSPPGTAMRYSNAGYAVVGAVIDTLTNSSWEEAVRLRIFERLDLAAGFGWPAAARASNPWGHQLIDGRLVPHPPDDSYQLEPWIAPAGDIHMSFMSFLRWQHANLEALSSGSGALSPRVIRTVHENGYGWGRQQFAGHNISGHTGSADTFFAAAIILHDIGMGVVVTTNATWERCEPATMELLKEIVRAL